MRLVSRQAVDHTDRFRELAEAIAALKAPNRARQTSASPFHDFRMSRGVVWLAPTVHVDLTYSEVMEGRLSDPVHRGTVAG